MTDVQEDLLGDWYRKALYVSPGKLTLLPNRSPIRNDLAVRPGRIRLTACMLCSLRHINKVRNHTQYALLKLDDMAAANNARFAFLINEIASLVR